jgi:hypothetical protein
MTVTRSVAEVLADHVTLEIESIDRMYCNLCVPQLQHVNGVVQTQPAARSSSSSPTARPTSDPMA